MAGRHYGDPERGFDRIATGPAGGGSARANGVRRETVAAIINARDSEIRPAQLAAELDRCAGKYIAPQNISRRWFVAGSLPLTATGKVSRVLMHDAALAGQYAAK